MSKEQPIYEITRETLQYTAMSLFDRVLNRNEMDSAIERVDDVVLEIEILIQQCLTEAVEINKLITRNKQAADRNVHYLVFSKNTNAFRTSYSLEFVARTEKEAREYVKLETPLVPFTDWRIARKDKNTEVEIAVIHSSPIREAS